MTCSPISSSSHSEQPRTWQNRSWEIVREAAWASLPLLTRLKPNFLFPLNIAIGAVRYSFSNFQSIIQFVTLLKEGNYEKVPAELFRTTVAVISLASIFFAHPLGLMLAAGYGLASELISLIGHLRDKNADEAIKSCFMIAGHSLFFLLFLASGLPFPIGKEGVRWEQWGSLLGSAVGIVGGTVEKWHQKQQVHKN